MFLYVQSRSDLGFSKYLNARKDVDSSKAEFLVRAILSPQGYRTEELACGSQAFIATLLFDPSMSALPIIPKQNSVSVGLFTH